MTCTDGCDEEVKAVVEAVANTTKIRGSNLPIGGLAGHHHNLCAFHKITQTLCRLMAINRCTRYQRAVMYTILAKVHATLRGSETRDELNGRLQQLHKDIEGNYVKPDERYLQPRVLKEPKWRRKTKSVDNCGTGDATKATAAKSKNAKKKVRRTSAACTNLSKSDEASPAIAQNMQGLDTYQVKNFVSYDKVNLEVLVAWDDDEESEVAQCAYELHCDLGDKVFRRLCADAKIDVAEVIESAGIDVGSAAGGAAVGVEVR